MRVHGSGTKALRDWQEYATLAKTGDNQKVPRDNDQEDRELGVNDAMIIHVALVVQVEDERIGVGWFNSVGTYKVIFAKGVVQERRQPPYLGELGTVRTAFLEAQKRNA